MKKIRNTSCCKSSKKQVLLILGCQQRKLYVSLYFLFKNFGFFKKKKYSRNRVQDEVGSIKLPTISRCIMLKILQFLKHSKYNFKFKCYCIVNFKANVQIFKLFVIENLKVYKFILSLQK